MPFTINTNIASLQAQGYLNQTQAFQDKTINEVTSGLRIVNSGDDAAGLAIANEYRSNEAVLTQGVANANDGLSQLQIADGGISNISQLLDRARTLATQSASGAFTGDRNVLNSEFQSVLQEIDRQAQAIGLNQGGTFAKALSVFIGGGQSSNGISATQNGSVAIDLSQSTVDSASLGLKGVQATGVAGTDIGSGSASTSLSAIVANTTNSQSVANPGYTTFVVRGPGFDGNGVKISVNTANLGGTSDLVSAVNAAIQGAANNGTQQGTALANAGIVASINTDSTGKQQLVFQSATTAFQVQAGDRLANALMGNFAQNAAAVSTDTSAYVDTSTNHSLTVSIDGNSLGAINVTSGAGTAKGQLVNDLNANSSFAAVATASLQGNQLVIQSKTNGSASKVLVTGSLATSLGFPTTASTAAPASTGATLNVQVQGAGPVAATSNVIGSNSAASLTIGANNKLYLTVGNSGAQTLTLTGGTNLTKADIAANINAQIAANGNFTAANQAQVTASVVNNQIVLTATTPGSNITIGSGATNADAALGLTEATYNTHVATANESVTLQFQGSGLASPVDITLNPVTAGTTTSAAMLADLQTKIASNSALQGAGISLTSDALGNQLVFTSNNGQQFQVMATGDSTNMLGLGSFLNGANGATDYSSITAGNAYSTSAPSGVANFQVSLNGLGSSSNTFSANLAAGDATAAATTGTVTYTAAGSGLVDLSGDAGTDKLALKIDGGATILTAAFGASATTGINSILSTINTALTGAGSTATATLNAAGNIVFTSGTKGANSSVEVAAAGAGASDANLLTQLGLSAGVHNGTNASEANVIQQLNQSIAGNSTLQAAGLVAQDAGGGSAGKIEIVSNNGTYFRLSAAGPGDAGFGNTGSSYAGTVQGAAPVVDPYFDSQGASASAVLGYSDTLFGSDAQNIGVTAYDANGNKHSLTVSLENNSNGRDQTIDQALSQINTALQQSNDSTLNQIVAVKEETGGAQTIRFLSTVPGFQVAVSSDPNGSGITPPTGNQTTAAVVGTGANADISNLSTATAAVTALGNAVTKLGDAQAVVGRGENQFNYAINLAQSQLTNFAAAESQIRDADLAKESANLTKSQIMLQAGVAALAQANSAPQQVLTLLQH